MKRHSKLVAVGLVGLVSSGCVGVRPVSRGEFATNLLARGAFKLGEVLVESAIERQGRWDEDTKAIIERTDPLQDNYAMWKGTIETRLDLISDPEDAEVYVINDMNSMRLGDKIGNTPFQYSVIDHDAVIYFNGIGNITGRINIPSMAVQDVKVQAGDSSVTKIHSGVIRFNFLFRKEGYEDAIGSVDFNAPYDEGVLRSVSASYNARNVNGEITHNSLGKVELCLVKE